VIEQFSQVPVMNKLFYLFNKVTSFISKITSVEILAMFSESPLTSRQYHRSLPVGPEPLLYLFFILYPGVKVIRYPRDEETFP
jgi:hypothetical protein